MAQRTMTKSRQVDGQPNGPISDHPMGLTCASNASYPCCKEPLAELGCSPTPGHKPKALQASECNELLDSKLPKGDPPPPADPSVGILPKGPTPLLCTLVHGLHYTCTRCKDGPGKITSRESLQASRSATTW